MKYLGKFNNINGDSVEVEVITNSDSSKITNLDLASNPVTIVSTSDGMFSPIKAESATIRILTTTIYSDMYASTEIQTSVKITNITKGFTLFWGYLTPNIYSQDYTGLDSLELEAISALSTLKHIKFKKTQDIVKWYDIICTALTKVGYTNFYYPNSYKLTIDDKNNLLKILYQFSDNFIDDDDEKTEWNYSEILEEFCKYFCLSLVIYHGEVYFIDYSNTNNYLKFTIKDGSVQNIKFNDTYIITKDSYKSTGSIISYDETFNKIAVKDNLYEKDNLLPDPMEDLENQNKDSNKFYEQTTKIKDKNYTYLTSYFKSKNWTNAQIVNELTPDNIKSQNQFSFWQKVDNYLTEEEPSSLTWDTYLTAVGKPLGMFGSYEFMITKPKESKDLICNGGYFVVNLDYKFSDNEYAHDCFTTSDQVYDTNKYCTDLNDTKFPCKLYVGDYYYDGEQWVAKSEYDRKVAKGYYKTVYMATFNPIPEWYRYIDKDGDWCYCTKSEWDKATSKKESGKVENSNKVYYFINNSNVKIFIDELYYNECKLKDKFYLVHKNKRYDKIFDEVKSLTNTVSWRMNLVDSEDGVAIKLPKFLLTGKLNFELYSPTVLGDYGQYRTDQESKLVTAVHIKNLEILYKVAGKAVDIFEGAALDDDVVYTNVINDDYVNEWDDLEIKVNSQVDDRITSLSSVLYKIAPSDKYYFLNKIYDNIYKVNKLQEEHIIERYYNHFKTPKLILEATLENKLKPYTKVTERNLNKVFTVDSYEIDVADDNINVKLIEY